MKKITFLGLGVMGYPMAGHLLNAGHEVTAYNRSLAKAEQWSAQFGAPATDNAQLAIQDAEVVILCVGRDDDVRELLTGKHQLLSKMTPGTLVIDHTTTSARLAEEMALAAQAYQVIFADAPVSGGEQGAINGQLSIMMGCEEQDFTKIREILAPYTRSIARLGPVGAGQKTKMVNQICIAGLIQALAEGLQFAKNAGLDLEQVMSVVGQGAAGSWQLTNRHQTMIKNEYNHGFAIDWMRKDLQICLEEALNNGSTLPITALVDQFYGELQSQGHGKCDTSALLLRFQ